MKTWRKFLILVDLIGIFALLGAPCGDGDSAGDANGVGDGLTSVTDGLDAHAVEEDYLVDASDFAGKTAVDWANAKKVRVEMNEFSFISDNLTFETGVPYILELVNTGAVKHESTSEEFFASVAWRKVKSPESEVKVPYCTEIEVFAGKSVELYFVSIVPTSVDSFELVCEIDEHLETGMFGTVTVTGDSITDPAPVYVPLGLYPGQPHDFAESRWTSRSGAQTSGTRERPASGFDQGRCTNQRRVLGTLPSVAKANCLITNGPWNIPPYRGIFFSTHSSSSSAVSK